MKRLGLILGLILGLAISAKHYESNKLDTSRQKLELERGYIELRPIQPEKPEYEADIDRIVFFFGIRNLPLADGDRVSVLVRTARKYGVDPYILAGLAFHESTGGKYACGHNYFGYDSCRVRFTDFAEAMVTVARTYAAYELADRDALSVWHIGAVGDRSGYPSKVIQTADKIRGL